MDLLCVLLYWYGKRGMGAGTLLLAHTLGYLTHQPTLFKRKKFRFFSAPYLAAKGEISLLAKHFLQLGVFEKPLDFTSLTTSNIAVLAYVLLCAIIGIIHFSNQKRNDSIRIRLFFQVFITIDIATIVFLFLQPQHFEALLSVLIVTTSPLIAHFFALTHTRITNWVFILLSAAALIITIINLWTLSPTF